MIDRMADALNKWPHQIFGLIVIVSILIIGGILLVRDSSTKSKAQLFTRNCTLNKGIAVRDLDNKMRCVPTFSAAKKESK